MIKSILIYMGLAISIGLTVFLYNNNQNKIELLQSKITSLNTKIIKRLDENSKIVFKKHQMAKMKIGSYCTTDKDFMVIKFSKDGNLKFWDETDGSEDFIKNNPPAMEGPYQISNNRIFFDFKEGKWPRSLSFSILRVLKDNTVTEFESVYGHLSYQNCTWQRRR